MRDCAKSVFALVERVCVCVERGHNHISIHFFSQIKCACLHLHYVFHAHINVGLASEQMYNWTFQHFLCSCVYYWMMGFYNHCAYVWMYNGALLFKKMSKFTKGTGCSGSFNCIFFHWLYLSSCLWDTRCQNHQTCCLESFFYPNTIISAYSVSWD